MKRLSMENLERRELMTVNVVENDALVHFAVEDDVLMAPSTMVAGDDCICVRGDVMDPGANHDNLMAAKVVSARDRVAEVDAVWQSPQGGDHAAFLRPSLVEPSGVLACEAELVPGSTVRPY